MKFLRLFVGYLWVGHSYVVARPANVSQPQVSSPLIATRDDDDPSDFSWVKRWAAIGDSFTAGIGSGNQLGSLLTADWKCSRYSYSWVQIVNQALGPSVRSFQFLACSGDRTPQIYDQVQALEGELDLVMLTAGGNDLCLAAMIKACVFLPWDGEKACQDVIDKAQSNIDTLLKSNIQDVLDALDDKMNKDSVVVYSGYAPFFNTDNEDCADNSKQNWAISEWWWISYWFRTALTLTIDRRKKFNTLVENINKAIKEVVEENDGQKKYRIAYSDWAKWPSIVDGQMCSPSDDGHYPNDKQPNMQFFKPNTYNVVVGHDGLKKRELNDSMEEFPALYQRHLDYEQQKAEQLAALSRDEIYGSILYHSNNPRSDVLHQLDPRAPLPAGCPGDGGPDIPLGIGLPDTFLENFHPNMHGHESMAATALQTLVWKRASILGKDTCEATEKDEIVCWSSLGTENQPYVSNSLLNSTYKDFCNNWVKPPANTINWRVDHKFNNDTYEEHDFSIELSDGAKDFDKQDCLDTFEKLINSCDTDEASNPMHWKSGGRYTKGNYKYEINPRWFRPFQTRADGECNSHYKFLFSDYDISGSGWAGSDAGQNSILPAIKGCLGLGVTKFNFQYCANKADCAGWEWKLSFRTPIWVKARCFGSELKVAKKAGGYHHKYGGSGYDDAGCGGSDA